MNRQWYHPRILAIFGVVALTALLVPACAARQNVNETAERPTEHFRREHAEIREHLAHLDEIVGRLGSAETEKARESMDSVARFLDEHIKSHAEWEERVLYPAIDRSAGGGKPRFTASMRHEHEIVGRRIDELVAAAARTDVDPRVFARQADRLLGIIAAHFEKEENVLLPVLDRSMSREEFEREVLDRMDE